MERLDGAWVVSAWVVSAWVVTTMERLDGAWARRRSVLMVLGSSRRMSVMNHDGANTANFQLAKQWVVSDSSESSVRLSL